MKKIEDFKAEKIKIDNIYGGKQPQLTKTITGMNEDYISDE